MPSALPEVTPLAEPTSVASAAPTPARSSRPCAMPSALPTAEDALATPVDQIPILAFITRLQSMAPATQRSLFDSVVAFDRRRPNARASLIGYCVPVAASAATERALLVVTRTWSISERSDATKLDEFASALRTAIATHMLGAAIAESVRRPILAPFVVIDPMLFSLPPDPSEEDDLCLDGTRPSRTRTTFRPEYPPIARAAGAVGIVDVGVELDRFGFATAFYVVSSTAPATPAGQALSREALIAASLSRYDEACSGSDASADVYIFHAQFEGHSATGIDLKS